MKPTLPLGYYWDGNQITIRAERYDGAPVFEHIAIILDNEAFATFLAELTGGEITDDSIGR